MTAKIRRRTPLLYGITFRIILFIAAGCMVLSYLAVYINPIKSPIPLFFGLFWIPILTLNLLLLIIALLRRSYSAWIPLVALLPALLFSETFFKISGKNDTVYEGIKMRVETYNVGMFNAAKGISDRKEALRLIEKHIASVGSDAVCLQEVFLFDKEHIKEIFPEYKYRVYHFFPTKNHHCFGNVILSKHKIAGSGCISFKKSTNLALYADIIFYNDTIRLYNTHLESYNISFAALASAKKSNEVADYLGSKVKNTTVTRSKQVDAIFKNMASSPYPSIVCGDFNDTPMSYAYHKLSRRKKDTFKESGKGFSATYSALWPLLRIDYIFIPNNYECIRHSTPKLYFSDHYPTIAEFLKPSDL